MATTAQFYRPFKGEIDDSSWKALIRSALGSIVWLWWIQRLPMFLLAVPASYGVGAFAEMRYPHEVAIVAGAGFEAAYLGAIAFADQQLQQDRWSVLLWWGLNIGAVASSALINVLFASGGLFGGITAEDYVHGLPLPIVNFLYALLLHRNATKAVQMELLEEELLGAERRQRKEERREYMREYRSRNK